MILTLLFSLHFPRTYFKGCFYPPGVDRSLQTIACRVGPCKLETTKARGRRLSLRLETSPKEILSLSVLNWKLQPVWMSPYEITHDDKDVRCGLCLQGLAMEDRESQIPPEKWKESWAEACWEWGSLPACKQRRNSASFKVVVVTVQWDNTCKVPTQSLITAIQCSQYYPLRSLFMARSLRIVNLFWNQPSHRQGGSLLAHHQGPVLAISNNMISHFSFLRCLPSHGDVCACGSACVPFRAGKTHILSLLTELIK